MALEMTSRKSLTLLDDLAVGQGLRGRLVRAPSGSHPHRRTRILTAAAAFLARPGRNIGIL